MQQLPLPLFSGNPKLWRGSSFEATVYSQTIPDTEKLNYLVCYLRGKEFRAMRDYDIAPENYQVILKALTEKFWETSTIKKSLCNILSKGIIETGKR